MAKKRRRYVPLDVFFAHGDTAGKLRKKFGNDGLLTWVSLLATAKRSVPQGTFTYVTEDGGWGELGMGYPFTPVFTLDEFFTFTGQLKKTKKTRAGQVKHIEITRWGERNDEWKRESEADRKASKRAHSDPDIERTEPGLVPDMTPREVEYESESEPEGYLYTPIIQAWLDNAPPLRKHQPKVLTSRAYKSAVSKATGIYGESAVLAAVANYAKVVASPVHFFTYKWTLKDFLNRGIEDFVDDAEPLTNFASKETPRQRDRGMTFEQIMGMNGGEDGPRAINPFRSVA